MKRLITLLVSLLIISPLWAQKINYEAIDKQVLAFPAVHNTKELSDIIKANYKGEKQQTYAIYSWLSHYIKYDLPALNRKPTMLSKEEALQEVFKSKLAICQGYADIFVQVSHSLGLQCALVEGLTKQNDKVDALPHVWCVVNMNGKWQLVDPTWGAGMVVNGKYESKISHLYFCADPEFLIKTHLPFDPIWQLMENPLTYQLFSLGISNQKQNFHYQDSITKYLNADEIEKINGTLARLEKFSWKNQALVKDYIQHLQREKDNYNKDQFSNNFNLAVRNYNQGIKFLNQFIEYRNQQFKPVKGDWQIKALIDSVEHKLNAARETLNNIDSNAIQLREIAGLEKSILHTAEKVKDQQAFLNKYLALPKPYRASLFYDYHWIRN